MSTNFEFKSLQSFVSCETVTLQTVSMPANPVYLPAEDTVSCSLLHRAPVHCRALSFFSTRTAWTVPEFHPTAPPATISNAFMVCGFASPYRSYFLRTIVEKIPSSMALPGAPAPVASKFRHECCCSSPHAAEICAPLVSATWCADAADENRGMRPSTSVG